MLFASAEPLDEKSLAAQLPQGIDVNSRCCELQAEYASRGVNLVRINGKWTFRTAHRSGLAADQGIDRSRANCRALRSRRSPSSPITSR